MNWNEKKRVMFSKLIKRITTSDLETYFLVEGIKDERCLKSIGLKSKIIKLNGSKSIYDKLKNLKCKNLVVLVDFDETGDKLEKRIRMIAKTSFNVDFTLRKSLRSLLRHEVKDIESISTLIKCLEIEYPSDFCPFSLTLTPRIIDSR